MKLIYFKYRLQICKGFLHLPEFPSILRAVTRTPFPFKLQYCSLFFLTFLCQDNCRTSFRVSEALKEETVESSWQASLLPLRISLSILRLLRATAFAWFRTDDVAILAIPRAISVHAWRNSATRTQV